MKIDKHGFEIFQIAKRSQIPFHFLYALKHYQQKTSRLL